MQQKRLVIALLISTVILLGWGYFFPLKNQPPKPANSSPTPQASSSTQPTPAQAAQTKPSGSAATKDAAPQRTITIKTPLYEAKFDTRGAVAISWILKQNKENSRSLYSAAGSSKKQLPLELVSEEGLKHEPREAPLSLITGDAATDYLLASGIYTADGVEKSGSNQEITLAPNEKKRISFVLHDAVNNLEVKKSFTFSADDYTVDIETKLARGGQPVPQAKLQVGPSIGDQGIDHYSYYSVAPEAIASVNNKIERYAGNNINEHKGSQDSVPLGGNVDWAGVGDSYFAMVAVPSRPSDGLVYVSSEYDSQRGGKPEKRYLTRVLVPIATDGSRTVLYTGPKDHNLLKKESSDIGSRVGNNALDLEALINYGLLTTVSRPISSPILWSITKLQKLTGSWGVAIILFTIIIYSAFFPLKWRSSKAMKKAQKLAPKMKELQEKIKGMKQSDPRLKELQMEQLRLMKEGNPLGGCLPLLIQMPFLFALYRAITISLDFRQASFLWLPDLSAPEPYLIHVLPILMAATMIVLQLITPAPSADPVQRKMMAIGMPVFMLYILWSAPSGLLVYWLVGNIVGFSQQFLINHYTKTDGDDAALATKAELAGPRKKKT